MSKNAQRICYELDTEFFSREFVPKFWTVQNFGPEVPIDLRTARIDYDLQDSVKNFTNWLRISYESKNLSIRGIRRQFGS